MSRFPVLKEIGCGFAIGVANIIPGVSGGTFALILGLYDRLLGFLNNLGSAKLRGLLAQVRDGLGGRGWKPLGESLREGDWFFMARIALGAGLAIVACSKLMTWLLENQFEWTYAYFFGLILASLPMPMRMVQRWNAPRILALALGALLTIGVVALVDPSQKAMEKSAMLQQRVTISATESSVRVYGAGEFGAVFLGGALAVSAMVLPGISGSLVLILMGQYSVVVKAIGGLAHFSIPDILLLSVFSLGMVLGLLTFSRILDYALKRWRDTAMGLLSGLVLGSLWALWPFKQMLAPVDLWEKTSQGVQLLHGVVLRTQENVWPDSMVQLGLAVGMAALGVVTMLPFLLFQGRR